MPNYSPARPPTTELADRLRITLMRAVRRLKRETDGEHSVSVISALAMLASRGPMTLGALAEAEGVSRPSMTVLATAMLEQRLVSRAADPDDGRLVLVTITAEGKRILDVSRTRRNAYLTKWLAELDEEDRKVLERASTLLSQLVNRPQ